VRDTELGVDSRGLGVASGTLRCAVDGVDLLIVGDSATFTERPGDTGEAGLVGAGDMILDVLECELSGRRPLTRMLPLFENSSAPGDDRSSRLNKGIPRDEPRTESRSLGRGSRLDVSRSVRKRLSAARAAARDLLGDEHSCDNSPSIRGRLGLFLMVRILPLVTLDESVLSVPTVVALDSRLLAAVPNPESLRGSCS